MLFRKYHIVVFRDHEGCCRKFRMRGWVCAFLFLLIVGLGAGNVFLWQFYQSHSALTTLLAGSNKTVEEQKHQLLSLAGKLKKVEKDLTRIRDFDAKLRVMMNLDEEQGEAASSVGGGDEKAFSNDYLPIYRQELLARKMHNFLNQLSTDTQLEEVKQQQLVQAIRKNRDILASTPSIWPTEGWISSPFGKRRSPFTGRTDFHKGIDISNRIGTPIYAPAKGTVIFSGTDGGYGRSVVIDHGSGIITRYAHLHRSAVKKGDAVVRGDILAYMGNTGRSTGPHLHYEVRLNGVCKNPMRYILN